MTLIIVQRFSRVDAVQYLETGRSRLEFRQRFACRPKSVLSPRA